MPDNTPSALIEHSRLVELCRELITTSREITPVLDEEDRLNRVMAAAGALTFAPDSWLDDALNQAAAQLELEAGS